MSSSSLLRKSHIAPAPGKEGRCFQQCQDTAGVQRKGEIGRGVGNEDKNDEVAKKDGTAHTAQ
jgi:hypothetical protein